MKWKDNKYDLNNYFKSKNKLFIFQHPMVMGVLNITPNSFYEDSRNPSFEMAIAQADKMIQEGVDIIDIGGVSTQLNADLLTFEEEVGRVVPAIKEIKRNHPNILISSDTFRSEVAKITVDAGADIINDVYGGRYDKNMFSTVAQLDVPYILMHSRGFSNTMQEQCNYKDVVSDVCYELSQSLFELRSLGVKDVILDPGFGFAKSLDQNYQLFEGLPFLQTLDCPLLVGISRKSMIYNYLKSTPSQSLIGTTVLNTIGLLKSASIVRVHDVKEAVEVRELILKLKSSSNGFK